MSRQITGCRTPFLFSSAAGRGPAAESGSCGWGRWLSSPPGSSGPDGGGGDGGSWGRPALRLRTGSGPWCSALEPCLKREGERKRAMRGRGKRIYQRSLVWHGCSSQTGVLRYLLPQPSHCQPKRVSTINFLSITFFKFLCLSLCLPLSLCLSLPLSVSLSVSVCERTSLTWSLCFKTPWWWPHDRLEFCKVGPLTASISRPQYCQQRNDMKWNDSTGHRGLGWMGFY